MVDYVNSQTLGDKVKVTYQEDGKVKTAEGKIITLENGKNGIGIGLIDRTEVSSDVPIKFSTAGIGGPSAGMMFSLSIYTQIADPTLRNGRIMLAQEVSTEMEMLVILVELTKKLLLLQKKELLYSLLLTIQ